MFATFRQFHAYAMCDYERKYMPAVQLWIRVRVPINNKPNARQKPQLFCLVSALLLCPVGVFKMHELFKTIHHVVKEIPIRNFDSYRYNSCCCNRCMYSETSPIRNSR